MDDAPELPTGYATLIGLTYFPPLWRKDDGPPVLAHYGGDITKVNVDPRRRAKILAAYGGGGMSQYRCPVCDYVYDEARRCAGRLPAGTEWSQIPTTGAAPTAGCARRSTSTR